MLTTMNEVLKIAEARNIAVGAFDTPNLENMFAVVKTAEKYNVPVILMYIPLLEDVAPVEFMAPVMVAVARNAKVPVAVHLDHCSDLERLKRCLELGFTSVMYDGSELSYEENVRNTKIAVEYARRYGAENRRICIRIRKMQSDLWRKQRLMHWRLPSERHTGFTLLHLNLILQGLRK